MGILAEVAGAVLSKTGAPQDQHSFLSSVLGLINHAEVGGLQGLVDKFKAAGLGNLAQGWIAQGPNPPVSPDQLHQVLSPDLLRGFAQKLGMDPDEATQHLAALLPGIVDHLTPDGSMPAGQIDAAKVLDGLKAKLFA